jgi:hypothetical protein
MLAPKINTVLLCVVILLLLYLLRHPAPQVGRFQQIDTPAHQVAFDTATGQRCWVWVDKGYESTSGFPLCSDLAKK